MIKKYKLERNILWALMAIGIALSVWTVYGQGPTGRAVTQITSLATGVTINADTGVITTFSATTAGAAAATFTVTNSACTANSTVIASVQNYAGTYGTNGLPVVNVGTVTDGAFNITIINAHASNALAGVLKIGFVVR